MTAIRLDPIDDGDRGALPVPCTVNDPQAPVERSRIRRGDIAAIAVVIAASVLFVVLFALVPILGAPD